MNVSSETVIYPTNYNRYMLNNTHPVVYTNASSIAVNNKIRAIQTRKSRITLHSYYDFTDIRPINISNTNAATHSSTNFSNLPAHKLLEKSKNLRMCRGSSRNNSRPSVLSSISNTNQQSVIWPTYNVFNGYTKRSQANTPTVPSTNAGLSTNKTSNNIMPDIHQRSHRTQTRTSQTLTEQQHFDSYVEAKRRSSQKTKSSLPKSYRNITKVKAQHSISPNKPLIVTRKDDLKKTKNNMSKNTTIHFYQSEDDDENIPTMDAEFEEYIQKSTIKCADWLLKYVIDKDYADIDE